MNSYKISSSQFTVITILYTIGSAILFIPAALAANAKQDGWLSALLAIILSIPLLLMYCSLAQRFKGLNLGQYCKIILGKWMGTFVIILFFIYFFLLSSFLLRDVGDFLTTQILPLTPIQFINIMFVLLIVLGIRLGFESIARTAEILFIFIIFLSLFLFIGLIPNLHFENIQPVLENGFKPVIKGSLPLMGVPFFQLSVFLVIFPFANNSKKSYKSFLVGTLIGGIYLLLISLYSLLVFGPDITANQYYPTYALAKKLSIGKFIERMEIITAEIWFFTIFIKLSITFYASILLFSEIFNINNYKQMTLPLAMLLTILSIIIYPNVSYTSMFASTVHVPFVATIGGILPLLLLIFSMIRKKKV